VTDVQLPDGSIARFPDGTSPEAMKAAIQKKFPPQNPSIRQGAAVVGESADPQNMYDTAVQRVRSDYGLNDPQTEALKQQYDPSLFNLARAGTTFGLSDELTGLSGGLASLASGKGFGTGYGDFSQLQNATMDLARAKNGMLGSAVELGTSLGTMGPERAAIDAAINGVKAAPGLLKTAASSGATGGILGGIGGFTNTDGDVAQRTQGAEQGALAGTALGTAAPVVARGLSALFSRNAAKTASPAFSDLKKEAGALYKAAEDSGVSVNRSGTITLADQMHALAQNEGLISPSGRVSSAYPKINEALKTFDDYAQGGSMSVPQIQSVTKTLQDAAGSADSGERRVGRLMLTQFKNFVAQGIPEIAQADPIYARAMRGKVMEKALAKGERKGNFTAKMAGVADKIADERLHGFSPEEIAAIEKAASPSLISQGLRGIAQASFRTPIANLVAFPLGMAAKAGATALDKRTAQIAAALVKNGPGVVGKLGKDQRRIAQALLNTGILGPASSQAYALSGGSGQ
jgi:hypothetical protein